MNQEQIDKNKKIMFYISIASIFVLLMMLMAVDMIMLNTGLTVCKEKGHEYLDVSTLSNAVCVDKKTVTLNDHDNMLTIFYDYTLINGEWKLTKEYQYWEITTLSRNALLRV